MIKRFAGILFLASVAAAWAQPVHTFTNTSVTTVYYNAGSANTPQIDALNFVNEGTFIAVNGGQTLPPYETSRTVNYTNTGTIIADTGFRFRNNPVSAGVPVWSRTFYNGPQGVVDAATFLLVSATNIINRGLLQVGTDGLIALTGNAVDLSESLLNVPSLGGVQSDTFVVLTNFFIPAAGVYDSYWSATNLAPNTREIDLAELWRENAGTWFATAPDITGNVPPPSQAVPGFTIPVLPGFADSYITNIGSATLTLTQQSGDPLDIQVASNLVKQAVFVLVPPGFTSQIGFSGGVRKTVRVLLSSAYTNIITGQVETNSVRFEDTLASMGGGALLQNFFDGTYRPTNYAVARLNVDVGEPGNLGFPDPEFFTESQSDVLFPAPLVLGETATNTVITNGLYSAYEAILDTVVSRPPGVAGGSFTNLPGSIRIDAGTLDLTDARIVAQGQVSINASNLVGSSGAIIDAENLSFKIGSIAQDLVVQDLIPEVVQGRIRGTIRAWSGFWTNSFTQQIGGNYEDQDGTMVEVPLTNTVDVLYHVLILDASGLANALSSTVYNLNAQAPAIRLVDDLTLVQGMRLDARSLSVEGILNIPGFLPTDPITGLAAPGAPLRDWSGTNTPTVLFLTNNGTIFVANTVDWGVEGRGRYYAIVNNGTISAAGLKADTLLFSNSGELSTTGPIDIRFGTALFTNGLVTSSAGDVTLTGNNLGFAGSTISANRVNLSVTDALTDWGIPSFLHTTAGFNLAVKPKAGDLLSTTISNHVSQLTPTTVRITWAGEDRGDSAAGFENNAAIGRVHLSATVPGTKVRFSGAGPAGTTNAIYIDELIFGNNLGNFDTNFNATNIIIDPNMRIYYAEATAGGVSVAEKLNGRFGRDGASGGQFIWVNSYAGTFSGVTLDYSGTLLRFNRALTQSPNVDTDNDSSLNVDDPTPIPAELAFTGSPVIPVFPDLNFPLDMDASANSGLAGARGTYSGLFYVPADVAPESSGALTVTVTDKGRFSAKLRSALGTQSFSGRFDSLGNTTNFVAGSYEVELHLDLSGRGEITGRILADDWTADLMADRINYNRKSKPAPFAGKYTMLIPGAPEEDGRPAGHGFGTVTVNKDGIVQWSGVLADGTKLSQRSSISSEGYWPLYAPLYGGEGVLIGWIQFADEVETDFSGQTIWIKPEGLGGLHPLGFRHPAFAEGSRYTPPPNIRSGVAVFTDGDLVNSITNNFTLNKHFSVSKAAPNNFSLAISSGTGLFKGSVEDAEGATIVFRGAILEKRRIGGGFFQGFENSGQVHIHATP